MTKASNANAYVRLFNAAIDDAADSPAGVVIRGSLDISTLPNLVCDDYQREAQPLSSQGRIIEALKDGTRLPDTDLGMRGDTFQVEKGVYILKDPTYIIDGNQRISTIIRYGEANPHLKLRIGAVVHLNTTKEWERNRFHKLNNWRKKLSPNILLRNMAETNPGIQMLYNLTTKDRAFPLNQRVSWSQNMSRGELVTALTFAKPVAILHSHKVSTANGNVEEIGRGMQKLIETVGVNTVRDNIKTYVDLIDSCWGIKAIQYKEGAIYLRGTFLNVLARILSNHYDFWQDPAEKRLFINADLRRKIAQFSINEPEVVRLSGSSGPSREILYILLRNHINSGKRTKRLIPRSTECTADESEEGDGEEDSKVA